MKTLVLFLFGLAAFAQGKVIELDHPSSRVVNGENVKLGEIPFQVSLQTSYHFCGGSIISEEWVVTAAHCVPNGLKKGLKVIVGTVNFEEEAYTAYEAIQVIVHESYTPSDSNRNDIALIKVATPFKFSKFVQPVPLPPASFKIKTNTTAVVSGWGGLKDTWGPSPKILQKAEIYIADPEYCRNTMKEVLKDIYDTHLCANDPTMRRGQCNGDSGGPLTVGGVLNGIVSWSIKDPDCASTKFPGVYTRVSEYVNWIHQQINN